MSSVYSSYIKRMRMCVNENCEGCTYQYEGLTNTEECKEDLLYDAAEQLEDADKCNARLVKKCKEMDKRIADLETALAACRARNGEQLPKEGEWLDEQRGRWIYAKCNLCGKVQDVRSNYCPNCGAKMKGEDDADN